MTRELLFVVMAGAMFYLGFLLVVHTLAGMGWTA